MNTVIVYNINSTGHGRGHRRNKNDRTVAAVLLDDEARDQRFLDLNQGRLETRRLRMIGKSRRQTAKSGVAGNLFVDSPLRGAFCLFANGSLNNNPDKKAQPYEYQDRNNAGVPDGLRQMLAYRLDENFKVTQRLEHEQHRQ